MGVASRQDHGDPAPGAGRRRGSRVLVYSCSGSSNVAQLANHIAVRMDRLGIADMSCIVGVGGGVRALVRKATGETPIVAIDGCPLACCETVLGARGVEPARIVRLHERGLRKRQHADFDEAEREAIFRDVLAELAPVLIAQDPAVGPAIEAALREGAIEHGAA